MDKSGQKLPTHPSRPHDIWRANGRTVIIMKTTATYKGKETNKQYGKLASSKTGIKVGKPLPVLVLDLVVFRLGCCHVAEFESWQRVSRDATSLVPLIPNGPPRPLLLINHIPPFRSLPLFLRSLSFYFFPPCFPLSLSQPSILPPSSSSSSSSIPFDLKEKKRRGIAHQVRFVLYLVLILDLEG